MNLLEEQAAGHGAIEDLGETELGLPDRELIAVARSAILGGERVRQLPQPLARERVDLFGREPIAEPLDPPGVGTRQNAVIERFVGDPPLGELPLHVLVAVEAEFGIVRKVRAELQEERAEVPIHGVEVEVVDHRRRTDEPGIGLAGRGVAALLGPQHGRLLLRPPDEHHALGGGEALQVRRHHVVLVWRCCADSRNAPRSRSGHAWH